MGLRNRLRSLLRPTGDPAVQHQLDELAADLQAAQAARAELESQIARLDKRLGMAMGAVQAATAQLMSVKQVAEEAQATARQANQRSTSALSAAESAADAVAEL